MVSANFMVGELISYRSKGMSDALTNSLVDRTRSASPLVIKYVYRFECRLYPDVNYFTGTYHTVP